MHLQWIEDLIHHQTNGLAAETRLRECQINRSRESEHQLLSQISGILPAGKPKILPSVEIQMLYFGDTGVLQECLIKQITLRTTNLL